MRFNNHYKCPCGYEWEDEWDCMCNDRCPVCNKEIEPHHSDESCPVCESFTCKGCDIPDDAVITDYVKGTREERVDSGLQEAIDNWFAKRKPVFEKAKEAFHQQQ